MLAANFRTMQAARSLRSIAVRYGPAPRIGIRAFTLIRLFFTNVGQTLEAEDR